MIHFYFKEAITSIYIYWISVLGFFLIILFYSKLKEMKKKLQLF